MSADQQEFRDCLVCREKRPHNEYSKTQVKKGEGGSKCTHCITASSNSNSNGSLKINTSTITTTGNASHPQQKHQQQQIPTVLSLGPRPQKEVGCGLEGLTVCADWPKTKSGQPPGAQSAVFMPLLACAMGEPIEGHCTKDQLEQAQIWWAACLPAWPRWIQALRDAGVQAKSAQLFSSSSSSSIKGNANPLIHKAKGHGTVPHLKGKIQRNLLEMDPSVAWELDACVQCLYMYCHE